MFSRDEIVEKQNLAIGSVEAENLRVNEENLSRT